MYLPLAFCSNVIVGFCAFGSLDPVAKTLNPVDGAEWLVGRRLSCVVTGSLLFGCSHGGTTDESGVSTGVDSCILKSNCFKNTWSYSKII